MGTRVVAIASEITSEIATNDSVDSFPPFHLSAEKGAAGKSAHTFENCGVPRLDRQSSDVGNDLGASLEDDQQNSYGATDFFQCKAIVKKGPESHLAHFHLSQREASRGLGVYRPGSPKLRTFRMPCSISSYFPGRDKSSLFKTLWLS